MSAVADPATGLEFREIGHRWGHGVPSMPGEADVSLYRSVKYGQHGVMVRRIRMVMHSGTHLNAPIHLVRKGAGVGALALDAPFRKWGYPQHCTGKWELAEAAGLEAATPGIQPGDRVVIVTGGHRKFSDSLEYFGENPGHPQTRRRACRSGGSARSKSSPAWRSTCSRRDLMSAPGRSCVPTAATRRVRR